MDPADKNREGQASQTDRDEMDQGQTGESERQKHVERNMGQEPGGAPDRDAELQKEGNLGNERNRNEPDTEPRADANRGNLDS